MERRKKQNDLSIEFLIVPTREENKKMSYRLENGKKKKKKEKEEAR